MEKLIRNKGFILDMIDDSMLVKEAEMFLKKHNLCINEIVYNRSVEYDGKSTFEILTSDLQSLEKLAQETSRTLRKDYDERSSFKMLEIEQSEYDMRILYRN